MTQAQPALNGLATDDILHDSDRLVMQDMWTLSGIFRDVYILGRPPSAHVADYHIQTPMEFDSDGSLESVALDVTVYLSAQVCQSAPVQHKQLHQLPYLRSHLLSLPGANVDMV